MAVMLEIIYASSATKPFRDDELGALLTRARINNTRLGVTGMLLYDSGSFLQALEGDPLVVKKLFDKIGADSRHKRIVKLSESVTKERAFKDWSMGLLSLNRLRMLEAGVPPAFGARTELPDFTAGGDVSRAREMMVAFCQGRWRTYVEA